MPPHPTPTPRQRAILKKNAKRTYGFPAVGIYIIYMIYMIYMMYMMYMIYMIYMIYTFFSVG